MIVQRLYFELDGMEKTRGKKKRPLEKITGNAGRSSRKHC